MASKIYGYVMAFVFFAVFAVALINFGIYMGNDNNSSQSIGTIPRLQNYSQGLTTQISEANGSFSGVNDAFGNSITSLTGTLPVFNAVGGIWKTIISTPKAIWDLTLPFVYDILGQNAGQIVIGALVSLLILGVIIAVVYWWTRGEGGT